MERVWEEGRGGNCHSDVVVEDSPCVEGAALELWETFQGEVALALEEMVLKVISLYQDSIHINKKCVKKR